MKIKYLLLLLLFVFTINSFSQGGMIVTDPIRDIESASRWIEEKQWQLNQAVDRAEQIQTLREQLDNMQKTKMAVEGAYKLQEKVQEDLRVLGSVADGGVAGLVHAFETRLGRSVNPTNYIPNIPQFQGLRETMSYDAKTKISSDTRRSHRELFTHNPKNPDNKGGLSLTRNVRSLSATVLTGAYHFSNLWKEYEDESQADAIDRLNYLAAEMREMAKKIAEELNEEGKYALTQGERMELMLYVADLHDKADEYDEKVKEKVRIEIEKVKLKPHEIKELVIEGIDIRMANTFTNSVKPYNSRQKFSLASFEKGYVQGKIDREIRESKTVIYLDGTEGKYVEPISRYTEDSPFFY